MTIRSASDTDRKRWNAAVSHPLQSWEWGQFRTAMGVSVERIVNEHDGAIRCWQMTFHAIPATGFTVGYFPKGPTPTRDMISAVREAGNRHKAVSVQLEPQTPAGDAFRPATLGLLPSTHPLFTKYTFLLDLTRTEDDMLAAMHQKTRYNIRIAKKHGVSVTEDNSDRAFAAYLSLNAETTGRQGFYAHNARYHETMWRIMKDAGIARMFTASYKNEILAAWILFGWKDTVYYPYGTSSRKYREVMAPTLMLWEIARQYKKEGYKTFDLWGALGPDASDKDPWYGFHRFKQGFGPALVEYVGSYDTVIRPVAYRLYTLANAIRWSLLRLKASS